MLTANLPAPPPKRNRFWTPELREVVRQRYIILGEPSSVVAQAIGCDAGGVRRIASIEGWVRDPSVTKRNALIANKARFALEREEREASRPVAPKPRRDVVAPRPVEDFSTVSDRILKALSERPLSAVSLASIIDAKELLVSMELSVLAHLGLVEAGPVGERGLRHRVWSSLVESAASLRCGPDSSVVAGEAA